MEGFSHEILFGILVIFVAAMTQGATSFGFSLIGVPLLGILFPLQVAVPVLMIFSLILNSLVLYHIRAHVQLKKIIILVIFGILGTPFGVYLLKVLAEDTLKLVVGIIIVIVAGVNISGYHFTVKNEKISFIPIGLASGLLNGSVSLGGPPIVLFLNNQKVEKQAFRGNLTLYFWVINLFSIPAYFFSGLITQEVIRSAVYLFPGLILGTLIGIRIGNQVEEQLFKKISMSLIMGMGILSILSGI
jgi:uncharacterized protein